MMRKEEIKREEERKLREARIIAEEIYELKSVLSFIAKREGDIAEIILRDKKGEQRSIKTRGNDNYVKILMMMLYQRLHYLGETFNVLDPPEKDD